MTRCTMVGLKGRPSPLARPRLRRMAAISAQVWWSSSLSIVRPHLTVCLPHLPLGNLERLGLRLQSVHATPPGALPVDRTNSTTNSPALSLRSRYRNITTTTSRSASAPRIGTRPLEVPAPRGTPSHPSLARTGSIRARLLLFRVTAADRAHAVYTPDAAWPATADSRQAHPGAAELPRFGRQPFISTLQQRFTRVRLPGPHLTPHRAPSPHRSPRRSSANAA